MFRHLHHSRGKISLTLLLCLSFLFLCIQPAFAAESAPVAIMDANDEYIANNAVTLFKAAFNSDPDISDNLSPLDAVNARNLNTTTGSILTYVVQDEVLQTYSDGTALRATSNVQAYSQQNCSNNKGGYDSTTSVYVYSTIYFIERYEETTWRQLTRVTGGYDLVDTSMQVLSQSVTYAQNGAEFGGSQSGSFSPTSSSWSRYTGFTTYVSVLEYGAFGLVNHVTLKRSNGTSTWTHIHRNQL